MMRPEAIVQVRQNTNINKETIIFGAYVMVYTKTTIIQQGEFLILNCVSPIIV